MPTYQLELIPNPVGKSASIRVKPNYALKNPFVAISGGGDTNYTCGACNALLLESVRQGMVQGLAFFCGGCGCYNGVYGVPRKP